jgi:hypothetical protein
MLRTLLLVLLWRQPFALAADADSEIGDIDDVELQWHLFIMAADSAAATAVADDYLAADSAAAAAVADDYLAADSAAAAEVADDYGTAAEAEEAAAAEAGTATAAEETVAEDAGTANVAEEAVAEDAGTATVAAAAAEAAGTATAAGEQVVVEGTATVAEAAGTATVEVVAATAAEEAVAVGTATVAAAGKATVPKKADAFLLWRQHRVAENVAQNERLWYATSSASSSAAPPAAAVPDATPDAVTPHTPLVQLPAATVAAPDGGMKGGTYPFLVTAVTPARFFHPASAVVASDTDDPPAATARVGSGLAAS